MNVYFGLNLKELLILSEKLKTKKQGKKTFKKLKKKR